MTGYHQHLYRMLAIPLSRGSLIPQPTAVLQNQPQQAVLSAQEQPSETAHRIIY